MECMGRHLGGGAKVGEVAAANTERSVANSSLGFASSSIRDIRPAQDRLARAADNSHHLIIHTRASDGARGKPAQDSARHSFLDSRNLHDLAQARQTQRCEPIRALFQT